MYYAPEVRAKEFYRIFKEKSNKERIKFIKDAKIVGGIITEGRFENELNRLILEETGSLEDAKKIKQ